MVIVCGVAILLIILYFFTGCAKSQKLSNYDVVWSNGKCIFHASGMSIEQAQEMRKKWNFEDCDVEVVSDDSSDGKSKGVKKE